MQAKGMTKWNEGYQEVPGEHGPQKSRVFCGWSAAVYLGDFPR